MKAEFEKRIYEYAKSIVILSDLMSDKGSSRVIANQLVRSGTSVSANVIEAKSASSKKDYINFYNHALKSANETLFWLRLTQDTGKGHKEEFAKMVEETTQIAKILAASIITMRKNLRKEI